MKVRQARIENAHAIAEVQVKTWQSAYADIIDPAYLDSLSVEQRATQWRQTLSGDEKGKRHGSPIHVLVTEGSDGGVDGFAAWCDLGEETADESEADVEILAIYVLESVQGRGRGRALIEEVRRASGPNRPLIAWTLAAGSACAFYEAMGGKVVERGEHHSGGKSYPSVCYRLD